MNRHITANLWLLALTILICAVLYPLALLVVGQGVFNHKANGSLITDKDGKIVGSHLIAQPFVGEEYFQPRPSAVSYNAAATGGTNWGANNPNLRKRVVGLLGSMLKYKDGKPVGPDIVAWVRETLGPQQPELQSAADADLIAAHFEAWWQAHPQADVEPVPADLVMASGCGLDPHITLDGALYQLDRVAGKWAGTSNRDAGDVKKEIESLLREKASAPLGGAVGVDLVNVLEVNLALRAKYGS
jgi:K+-transporting ATPase c subunit